MMDKPVDTSLLGLLWQILVAIAAALLALGSFRAKVATKGDLEKTEAELLKRLYREDGTTIFVPRGECEKNQASCGDRVCEKLAEIQRTNAAAMAEMREGIERRHEEHLEAQREHLRLHGEMAEFVGAVKQFMRHHGKEG